MTSEFKAALDGWLKRAQAIVDATYANSTFHPVLSVDMGRRYARIWRKDYPTEGNRGSCFAFIDLTNGNVLKAASWKSPAKHARGTIFEIGKEGVSGYGGHYL